MEEEVREGEEGKGREREGRRRREIIIVVSISPIVICSKVNNSLQVMDPTNLHGNIHCSRPSNVKSTVITIKLHFKACTCTCNWILSLSLPPFLSPFLSPFPFSFPLSLSSSSLPLLVADISSDTYWRSPFISLFDHRQFKQFLVLQIEVLPGHFISRSASKRCILSEAWVAPLDEIERQIYCRTHLGHFLNPGDTVWGVDFTRANLNNEHYEKLKPNEVPDVVRGGGDCYCRNMERGRGERERERGEILTHSITQVLIKKSYGDRLKRHRKRKWQLQSLPKETEDKMEEGEEEKDLLDFMEDLEEDKTYREDINIYMSKYCM